MPIPPLFTASEASDRAYCNLRDEVSESARECKRFAEELWGRFHPYADRHFLDQIRREFNARFWEMYLTCTLLEDAPRLGYRVSCPKPGPDILLELNERRIWIEATEATDGEPDKPDFAGGDNSGKVPDGKIILRLTNAIDTKRKKYLNYCDKGLIAPDEPFLIAINGSALTYRWAEPEIPRILKAVFPIGALQYRIDRARGGIVGQGHQFRPTIPKVSGGPVSTQGFLQDDHRGISAILYSCANAASKPPLGCGSVVVLNPLADNPIGVDTIPCSTVYEARSVDENTYELVGTAGTVRCL